MDSTPGISISVAMSLLGHKTDIMFRRYIQKHDDRLVEAARRLARRPKEFSGIRTVTEAFTEAKVL
jgi:hypothetical protein